MKFKAKSFDCHVDINQQTFFYCMTVKFWVQVLILLPMVCLLGQKSEVL